MMHLTNIGPLEQVPRPNDKLSVQDINGFSQMKADKASFSNFQIEADWNQHKVYRQPDSPRRHMSSENIIHNSVDLASKIRHNKPSELVRNESLQEL